MIYDDLPVLIMARMSSSQTVSQLVMKLEGNIKSIKIPSKSNFYPHYPSISMAFLWDKCPMILSRCAVERKPPGGHRGKGNELLLDELLNVALSHLGHYPDARKIDGV